MGKLNNANQTALSYTGPMRGHPFLLLLLLLFPGICLAKTPSTLSFATWDDHILAIVGYAIPPENHAYAHEAGGTGLPANLDFQVAGEKMPVLYPEGSEEKDIYDPAATAKVYHGQIGFIAILPPGASGKQYQGHLSLLLCSSRRCQPVKENLAGIIPEQILPFSESEWARSGLLASMLANYSDTLTLEHGVAPEPVPEKISQPEGTAQPPDILAAPEDFDLKLSPRYARPELEIFSLGKALLFGLLAGLILNAMPCVLPVLAMKVNNLLAGGPAEPKERLYLFRRHNIFFAAGIITLFTILALLLGAADLMWGQLYQSQALLISMLLLVFLMGLSMLGVFTLPVLDLRMEAHAKSPALHSYISGLICTFLATPCSGPLLGGVLAWAFAQPLLSLLAVFWAVGLGMSLPYLVFCIWPHLAMLMPRPGPWMLTFERILGFMLLGTALYLLSILPAEKLLPCLCALLAVALGAWLWGHFCGLSAPALRRRMAGGASLIFLALIVIWLMQPPDPEPRWSPFSPASFASTLGKENLLLEFTADWCPNCKYLESAVLTEKNLSPLQKKYNLGLIKVDLTTTDAYAEKLLDMLGAKSIPLTAIFPAGDNASQPMVLRDIYNVDSLKDALKKTLKP